MQDSSLSLDSKAKDLSTLARGAGLVFAGTLAGLAFKYSFELMVARQLGTGLFGVFFLGFTLFKVLERVAVLGLPNGVLKYVSHYRSKGDWSRLKGTILSSLRLVLLAGLLMTAMGIAFSSAAAHRIFHEIRLAEILPLFAAAVVFSALTEILVFSSQAFQVMRYKVFVRMLFEPGLRILLAGILFILGWKLLGAVFAFIISVAAGMCLAFLFLKRLFPHLTSPKTLAVYETRSLFNFSWPLFFSGFLAFFFFQVSILMLGFFRSSQEVGIYAAAQRTAFMIPVILESFNAVFAPMLASLFQREDLKRMEDLFKIVTQWIFIISFPIFLLMIVFPKEILSLWGVDYISGFKALVIICCAQLINCAVGSVGYIIMMSGRTKINLANNFLALVMLVILNFLLIPKLGFWGAAISLSVTIAGINLLRLIEVYLILKIHPYRLDFLKTLAAGVFSLSALFLLRPVFLKIHPLIITLSLSAFLLIISYTALLFLFGISREAKHLGEEIKSFLLKFKKR